MENTNSQRLIGESPQFPTPDALRTIADWMDTYDRMAEVSKHVATVREWVKERPDEPNEADYPFAYLEAAS